MIFAGDRPAIPEGEETATHIIHVDDFTSDTFKENELKVVETNAVNTAAKEAPKSNVL